MVMQMTSSPAAFASSKTERNASGEGWEVFGFSPAVSRCQKISGVSVWPSV